MIKKLFHDIVMELQRLVATMVPTPRLAELILELLHRIYALLLLWLNDSPVKALLFST
jgi:hypothetical protein